MPPGRRSMRTRVLPGAVVRGSDGQLVGRVRDIYLHDRSGEFAAITVKPGQLSPRTVLIPAAAIADLATEGVDGPCIATDGADGAQADGGPADRAPADGADGGPADGAPADRGRADGGSPEGGRADGGSPEGGRADGGSPEGGRADGGSPEGGRADHGPRAAAAPTTETRAADALTTPGDAPQGQDTAVHLRVDSMTVRAGISAPDTDHATPEQLRLAARELGIEEAATG